MTTLEAEAEKQGQESKKQAENGLYDSYDRNMSERVILDHKKQLKKMDIAKLMSSRGRNNRV